MNKIQIQIQIHQQQTKSTVIQLMPSWSVSKKGKKQRTSKKMQNNCSKYLLDNFDILLSVWQT